FDGVASPTYAEWRGEGGRQRLGWREGRGAYRQLGLKNPPQSPVAWTTFATGTGPGRHGIFDFIERDPKSYLPDVGTGGVHPPQLWHDLYETTSAEGFTTRRGVPFWRTAAEAGGKAVVLRVPDAVPPEPLPGGAML